MRGARALLGRRVTYVGGAVVAAAAGLLLINGAGAQGCLESSQQRASRLAELHRTFSEIYDRNLQAIGNCQSVECDRAPKLEIADSLRSFNGGLRQICWSTNDKDAVDSLLDANSRMADTFARWSEATTPADEQAGAEVAGEVVQPQTAAYDALARHLGVPAASSTPAGLFRATLARSDRRPG